MRLAHSVLQVEHSMPEYITTTHADVLNAAAKALVDRISTLTLQVKVEIAFLGEKKYVC